MSAIEIMRENSAAFSRQDVGAMLALHAADAVVTDRRPVGFGEFHGHGGIRAYYEGLFDNAESLEEELTVVDADGASVLAAGVARVVLVGSDEPEVFNYALRVTVGDDGLIASVEIFENVEAARAA